MSEARSRVPRTIAGLVALVCTATCSFVAAAWLADRVTGQSDDVVHPPIEDPVVVPGPATTGAGGVPADGQVDGPTDPGAVMAVEEASPAVEGLPGGAWVLPVDLVAADDPEALAATQAQSETPGEAPGTTTDTMLIPADQAAATAEQLGSASLLPPLTAARFVDLCTEVSGGCPFGMAATVKPLSTGAAPGKLAIRVWPGMANTLVPNLRCDPGSSSSSVLPVVVTANTSLESLDLSLELPDGTVLSTVKVGESALEADWIKRWKESGYPTGTDLDDGAHYCASMPTLGDPTVAAALAATGKAAPVPLAYRLRAVARAPADPAAPDKGAQEATVVVDVPLASIPGEGGGRPNTIVQPLNGHVAQVIVPERNDATGRPTVWVANAGYWQDKVGLGTASAYCTKAPPGAPDPGFFDPPKPVLLPERQSYDPGQLAQASYPFDPAYTHYGVWNVVLQEATTYALCISWPLASGEEREAWALETPDGLAFSLTNLYFAPNGKQPYTTWYLRAHEVACYQTFERQEADVVGGALCASGGLPYPPAVTFEHQATYPKPYTGVGTVTDDLGTTKLLTPTWCPGPIAGVGAGPSPVANAVGDTSSLFAQCLSGSKDVRASWPVRFVYADQSVLCGDDACLEENRRATMSSQASVGEWNSNGRSRHPLDWGITGPAGDRSASPGGSAPGPTGP